MVGTRRISMLRQYSGTEDITSDLSRNKITIVSGLAKGTYFNSSQMCSRKHGGRTIAVFACGLDIASGRVRGAKAIIENGALISEYPLGTKTKTR